MDCMLVRLVTPMLIAMQEISVRRIMSGHGHRNVRNYGKTTRGALTLMSVNCQPSVGMRLHKMLRMTERAAYQNILKTLGLNSAGNPRMKNLLSKN